MSLPLIYLVYIYFKSHTVDCVLSEVTIDEKNITSLDVSYSLDLPRRKQFVGL